MRAEGSTAAVRGSDLRNHEPFRCERGRNTPIYSFYQAVKAQTFMLWRRLARRVNFPLAFSAAWGHVTAAPNLNSGQEPRGSLAASFERLVGTQPWGPALAGCKGGRRAPCPDHERGQRARDRVINLAWPGLRYPLRPLAIPMARSAERPTWPSHGPFGRETNLACPRTPLAEPPPLWQLEAAGRLRRKL